MRRLALAIALACVLSGAARAGEMPSTGAVAPPAQCTVTAAGEICTTAGATAPGEVPSTGAKEPQPSGTLLTVILTIISIGL